MQRLLLIYVALYGCLVKSNCQSEELRTQIDKIIRYDVEASLQHVPGYIIGIIDGDSSYVLSYGTRVPGTEELIEEQDVFEIGSVTKVMTAHILLQLYAEKMLEMDAPLNTFLPAEYQNPSMTATIREVMLHRSGLPKLPETLGETQIDPDSPYSGFARQDLLNWYRALENVGTASFRYSHAGYALLEIVIEQVTGSSYAKALNRFISEPLMLRHTNALHIESPVPGYDLAGHRAKTWSYRSFRTSEGVQSCLEDLRTYVRFLMYDEAIPLLWNTWLPTGDKKLHIAPGWYYFLPKKNFPVYVHTGRTSGHSAMIAFSRKTKTGIIVLANSSLGTDDLGLLILRMINKQWRRK